MQPVAVRVRRWAAAATGAVPASGLAHGPDPHALTDVWHAYSFDPAVVVPMALLAGLYSAGVARLWRRAGVGRGVERWRVGCFATAMLALGVALIWPLDVLGGAALSAHMAQHVLLTAFAAPLLAASAPVVTGLWALPSRWRRLIGAAGRRRALRSGAGVATLPIFAWCVYAATLWGWHMPGPYEAAVRNDALHMLEHFSFLGAALLLWWTVFLSVRGSALGLGSGIFLLFTTALQEGLLGALLTFSQRTLYPVYESAPGLWGISALEDQQLAGILMWIPGGLVYLSGALVLAYLWLAQLSRTHPVTKGLA